MLALLFSFLVASATEPSQVAAQTAASQNPYLIVKVSSKTSLRIRSGPSTSFRVVTFAKPGEIFEVERKGDWFEIKSGPYSGSYINANFVQSKDIIKAVPVAVTTSTTESHPAAKAEVAPATKPAAAPITTSTETTTSKPKSKFDVEEPAWTSATEKIFQQQAEKIFKKKAKAPAEENQVTMPVYFENNSKLLGQIQTRLITKEPLLVDAPIFFKYLHLVMDPQWFKKTEVVAIDSTVPWITLDKFENTGIKVSFDEQRLDIVISVPPELRNASSSSIFKSSEGLDDITNAEPPAFFSTYLNVNASEIFDTRYTSFDDRRAPAKAQLESGTNIGSFVLEANGRYIENRIGNDNTTPELSRSDIRLVKDFPNQTLRTSFGDLAYPIQGFQSFRQMAGFAMTSQFSMARSKLTYPTGKYEIFLQRDSKVYIWINNQLQKVIDLPAGRHSLQDFPFTSGANDIRFEIIDDVGRQETLNYSYFSSSELLRPELHQYSYAIGAPMSEQNNYDRVYDSTNLTLSSFHRYGWSEHLTLGANLQFDNQHSVLGSEALWSTPLGFFKLEPALASTASGLSGGALSGNYSYTDDKGPNHSSRSFNISLNHTGTTFTTLGSSVTGNSNSVSKNLELAMGYSQGLGPNTSGNISGAIGSYTSSLGELRSFTLRVGANRRWKDGPSLNGTVSHSRSLSGSEDFNLSLLLIWAFPQEKQNLSLIHGTADQTSRLDWSYNPAEGTDSANYSAAIRDNSKEQGYSGQISYTGNRMRTSLNQEVVINKQPDPNATGTSAASSKKTSDNVTTLLLGTSIAYAGGHFAIGRPVMDSFAIVAPVKNLKGQRLDINPTSDDHYLVKSDKLGAALVPEIGSYNPTAIVISGKNLPPQMTLPKDHFSIFPSYKSGYSFEVGTDATIYLTAKVFGPNNEPVALAAGRAVYLDDSNEPPITVFTNKSGTLRSEGFKAGRYRLEISSGTFAPIEIVVPESPNDSFDLGTIKLKAE